MTLLTTRWTNTRPPKRTQKELNGTYRWDVRIHPRTVRNQTPLPVYTIRATMKKPLSYPRISTIAYTPTKKAPLGTELVAQRRVEARSN